MLDIRQTPRYAKYLSRVGWKVERVNNVNYFIKKFLLIGSVIKIQRPEKLRYNDIKILGEKHRAFQVIIEPKDMANGQWLMANRFKLSNSPYLPTKTLQLDLTKSKNQLLREMKKDARNALRKTIHYELCTMNPKIEDFRNAWKQTVGWKRYVPPLKNLVALKNSFKTNCRLIVCYHDSNHGNNVEVVCGAIFLKTKNIAYYWQAFTNAKGRKLKAQYKIVWEGILWARKKGARVFDFEGIYDERFPNKSWLGFTHFKKSFGGYEVSCPGTFVKWFP